MEQWNNNSKQHFISLNEFLERYYLKTLIEVKGLNINELEGETLKAKIDSAEKSENKSQETESQETIEYIAQKQNFVDYRKNILFQILNIFLENAEKKLRNNDNRYFFTARNCDFFELLLDVHEEKNDSFKALMEGRYGDIDEIFREILYRELSDLTKNPKFSIDMEFIQEKWNLLFCPAYGEVRAVMEDLRFFVLHYGGAISGTEENIIVLNEMKQKIEKCGEEVRKMAKERADFSGINIDEIEKNLKENNIKRNKRVEQGKATWNKRLEKANKCK